MMTTINQKRGKMSILDSIKQTYNQIPKEPAIKPKPAVSPTNQDLMDQVKSNLDKNPQIVPKVK